MTDLGLIQMMSRDRPPRLGWKVNPVTGEEYYDPEEAEDYYLGIMLEAAIRRLEEKRNNQKD